MGMPAYRAFTVFHDLSNLKMGFASSGNAVVTQGNLGANNARYLLVAASASLLAIVSTIL